MCVLVTILVVLGFTFVKLMSASLPPVADEQYAGVYQCQAESCVKNRDEAIGEKSECPDDDSKSYHQDHNYPPFGIEKTERTVFVVFLILYPARVFVK